MRRPGPALLVALAVLLPAAAAVAQEPAPASVQAEPLPAPQLPAAEQPPAPDQPGAAQQQPGAPTASGQPAEPGAPGAEAAPATPPPPAWLPRAAAKLILLDKIAAQPQTLTVKVGTQATFGSLTIAVGACDVRPPDVPADAAALLTITDRNAGMPGFTGWMLADEPGAAMLQHPMYDVRLAGCTG